MFPQNAFFSQAHYMQAGMSIASYGKVANTLVVIGFVIPGAYVPAVQPNSSITWKMTRGTNWFFAETAESF